VAVVGALAAASAFAVGLVVLRLLLSGGVHYGGLAWNLVLAWVPLVFSLLAYDRHRRGRRGLQIALPLAVWLAFLPNAPYLVTDFVHLRSVQDMPIWFDVALLSTFAWTGLVLGFVSVYLVHQVVREAAGATAGWLCAVGSLVVSGLGVYLGRYLRWNSWDLVVQPGSVLSDVAAQLASPRLVGMTLMMGAFLTVAYATLYAVLHAALDERAGRH
jgi:uncharacterized membrane protein